jgi:hypothetical protein
VTPPLNSEDSIKALAEPRSADLEAWLRVSLHFIPGSEPKHARGARDQRSGDRTDVANFGIVKSRYVSLYRDLRHLRNQAAHEIDFLSVKPVGRELPGFGSQT